MEKTGHLRAGGRAGGVGITSGNPGEGMLLGEGFALDFRDAPHAGDGETEGGMGNRGKVHAEEGE